MRRGGSVAAQHCYQVCLTRRKMTQGRETFSPAPLLPSPTLAEEERPFVGPGRRESLCERLLDHDLSLLVPSPRP